MSEQNNPGEPQQHANADTAGVDPVAETDADHEAVTGADAADKPGRAARLRAGMTKPRVLAAAAGAAFLLVGGVAGYAIAGGDDGHDGRQGHGDRANHSGWQADQYDEHGHGGGGR
ncbi:MAG: hypothetical protein WBV37_08415 [Nocardioidaceae bacterium]